ncbi:MAG TPA: cysteine methyltransferase [Eggerthellaceae bacterium]|nr:cysteine methyltransferase [Eggerthellaceae bacterium]
MAYFTTYDSGLIGRLTLASDGTSLIGCWFDNDRYFGCGIDGALTHRDDLPIFEQARSWLDRYFAGAAPDPRELPLAARATAFQLRVREAMLDIPYGQITTYGAIAERIGCETGKRSSARAVGGAVGHNPLCLIVPCHRVLGANGSLTGFGGGIDMKVKLLEHERVRVDAFRRPKKGTALEGDPHAAHRFFEAAVAASTGKGAIA